MSVNVNGLRGKLNDIILRATAEAPQIIACQETKIGKNVDSCTLKINGFKLFRKDRNENGGGVALYIAEALKPKQINEGI
jgi:exonuclease III